MRGYLPKIMKNYEPKHKQYTISTMLFDSFEKVSAMLERLENQGGIKKDTKVFEVTQVYIPKKRSLFEFETQLEVKVPNK